jgi:hypothetical protein
LISNFSQAADIALGLYELDTEAGWAAGFELKENDKVIITPAFGNEEEDYDESGKSLTKKPDVVASWKKTKDGIEISYGKVVDSFKYTPNQCEHWSENPCFQHIKSQETKGEKSILNYTQVWVNRNTKVKPSQDLIAKKQRACESQCSMMVLKGELKKGMNLKSCIKELCK